jgi:hypothetical protein
MSQRELIDAVAKVAAAAEAGDHDALRIVDALTTTAGTLPEPAISGSGLGLAEALKRFGPTCGGPTN